MTSVLLSPKAVGAAAAADARMARRALVARFRRWHDLAAARGRGRLATRARRRRLTASAVAALRMYARRARAHRRRVGAVVAVVSLLEMNLVVRYAFRRWRARAQYLNRLVAWAGVRLLPNYFSFPLLFFIDL
jgi:hypothetical protein